MSKETKHLIFWWFEWLKRLIRTTYHLFNRRAYHIWKANRQYRKYTWNVDFDALNNGEMDEFH